MASVTGAGSWFGGGRTATGGAVATAVGLLVGAIVFGRGGAVFVLPFAAAFAVAAVAIHRPRGRPWWWAAVGSGFWAVEEAYWVSVRLFEAPSAVPVSDLLYWLGGSCWLVALLRLPNKRIPRWSMVALPPLVAVAILLMRDPSQTLSLRFPLLEALLLLATLPALEGVLRGRASEGRLLWVLGFFVRALTAANFSWLSAAGGDPTPFYLTWILAYLLIGIGVWLEVRDETGGPWPVATALVGLEVVVFVMTGLLFAREGATDPAWLSVSALAYVQLLAVLAIVLSDRRKRMKAEADLRGWHALVQGLARAPASGDRDRRPLEGLWAEACRLLPDLRGLTLAGEERPTLGVAAPYGFPVVMDGAETARLHFERQPEESTLLDALAPLVGRQIRQMQDRELLHGHATTDPLTGLLNRRGLDHALSDLDDRASRGRRSLVVTMLDLDHFKRVNDLHGHPVGDDVLKLVARLLRNHTRDHDLVVRWGGEEFVIVLMDMDLAGAQGILSRLRRALRDATPAPLTHPLSFSAGIARGSAPGGREDLYDRISEADAALLLAKRRGRDRIEGAPSLPEASPTSPKLDS